MPGTNTAGYTARQLINYYRVAKEQPGIRILPPGGQKGWDDMPASRWLAWFMECLMAKINRGMPPRGRGSKAQRRAKRVADAAAECKWCGIKTGARCRPFCSVSCARSYNA